MKHTPPATRTSRTGDITVTNPDGTTGYPALGITYLPTGTAVVDAPTSIGVKVAAKLAVVECLLNLPAFDIQPTEAARAAERGESLPPAPRIELRPKAISINYPEAGTDHAPLKISVTDGSEGYTYNDLGLSGPDYLDHTLDKFGRGTVLIHTHDVTGTVVIECLVSTQTARDAVEVALERAFGVEPNDMRTGRRICLKAYYDQDVRITLARIPFSTADKPDDVQSNDYPLYCYLDVDIPNVRLVKSPGLIQESDLPRV